MTPYRRSLPLALLLVSVASLSACGYAEEKSTIERALHENVESIPGVTEADTHVNVNTSGTFISLDITANSYDEEELKNIAREALTRIARDARIENGTFSMGVFSPDSSVNIGPSDVGCDTKASLSILRECFA